jgi:hypothetical protein
MALTYNQFPATASLVQSPTIFTLSESGLVYTSASFQYYLDLYYWDGTPNQSSSIQNYTLVKYPNASGVGIFDVGRILNSTLTASAELNPSNVKYFKVDGYFRYLSSSIYVTSSHVESGTYKALDGYALFDEPIGQQITSKSVHWPLMTDGPASQSVLSSDIGFGGVYVGTTGFTQPNKLVYTGNLGSANFTLSGSVSSSQQIQQYPLAPQSNGFPISTLSDSYSIQAFNDSTALGSPVYYEVVCQQKYPNVRLKWKNRYGQFDWFSFYMVNKQSFSTEKRSYQPQLGTWTGTTLSYNQSDSSNLNYIVDSKQSIQINTDWIDESYNDIFKQLLVSEEIYWVKSSTDLLPLTISTNSLTFKTGVVDKLIQYTFELDFGQGYKLIL